MRIRACPLAPWRSLLVALSVVLFAIAAQTTVARVTYSDPSAVDSLAPTTAVPWNPDHEVHAKETWETVVRLPGQIASLPFVVAGQGVRRGLVFVEENDVVPRVAAHFSVLREYGVIAGPANLGDRTGWGGEIGINPTFFRDFSATLGGSTGGYNRGAVKLQSHFGRVSYESMWRPQDLFFGIGPQSRQENASTLASQEQSAVLELWVPFRRRHMPHVVLDDPSSSTETNLGMRPTFQVWAGPRDEILLDGRERTSKRLPIAERFAPLPSGIIDTRVEHFVYGARAEVDNRAGRPHWWKGWRTSVGVERYDLPLEAFAFHSASTPSVAFTRWTYEGETGASFWHDPRTFRLFLRAIDQRGVASPGTFLLTDYATLGGRNGLWGFEPGRFRDNDLALARLTYIFPLARYLEMDLHAETGGVEAQLSDLRLDQLKQSYGLAVRIRNLYAPLGFVGVDWSSEKVRVRFALGGVE